VALDALRVALQGLYRLTPIALAVQGLIDEVREEWDTSQGVAGRRTPRPQAQTPAESNLLDDEAPLRQRQARDRQNALILQLVTTAVTQGLL
jgi:hypothetical protein